MPGRLRCAPAVQRPRATMRAIFVLYWVIIVAGLALWIGVGLVVD